MSRMFFIVLAVIAAAILAIALPSFIKARAIRSAAPCINRLWQIDAAKQQWALEQHKSTNDTPTWSDISPYIYLPYFTNHWFTNGIPFCPEGGTYTFGRVGQPPTCSLGDKKPNHKLP